MLLSAPEYVLFFLFNLDSVYFMEKTVSEKHGPLSHLHLLPPQNASLYLSRATFLDSLLTRIQFRGSVPDLLAPFLLWKETQAPCIWKAATLNSCCEDHAVLLSQG